jgi:coenzyme Q-binding protein COQ10
MITHTDQKLLPYSQEQLYKLVADIERYPEFLPWCQSAIIHQRQGNNLIAELEIGYKFFRETYMSEVTLTPTSEIKVQYAKGPLKHLINQWCFQAVSLNTCQVDFELEFELKSSFLQKATETIFTTIVHQMLSAFEARAKLLYS